MTFPEIFWTLALTAGYSVLILSGGILYALFLAQYEVWKNKREEAKRKAYIIKFPFDRRPKGSSLDVRKSAKKYCDLKEEI